MSSASRVLIGRSSALRPLKRSQAVPASRPLNQQLPVSRRSYTDIHAVAKNTSETPWLLTSVGVTITGLAYLQATKRKPQQKSPEKPNSHNNNTPKPAKNQAQEPKPQSQDPKKPQEPKKSQETQQQQQQQQTSPPNPPENNEPKSKEGARASVAAAPSLPDGQEKGAEAKETVRTYFSIHPLGRCKP
ncbi:hypothetical protein F4861DRAFT_510725 [Xylaria intraflava]|nr:hypothetical protein F4861DRAFT_510725 [Xylaria intraflava]